MTRKVLWPVLVIGVLLIVAPFAISLPSKASSGQKMLDSFNPIMKPAHVQQTADYYFNTFAKLRPVAEGAPVAASEIQPMMNMFAAAFHMTPAQVESVFASQFPAMSQLLTAFPSMTSVFKNVPPGLDFYKPLVTTMQANVNTYKDVDSLPNMNLFTWFFVIPGALLVILALLGLFGGSKPATGLGPSVSAGFEKATTR
jgi:hypothetical protein